MLIDFDDRLPTIDASLGGFMDGSCKSQLVTASFRAAKDVATLSQRNDIGLCRALVARKYGNNRSKQGVVVSLGSRQLARETAQAL
eukprot:6836465-Pyramimonas_sp.AAC.1